MEDDEPKGTNRVFKRPCKRQRHLNVGSTNSMGSKSNIASSPGSEGNMPIYTIVHAHLCRQGGTSKALGSSTNNGNPKVKLSKPITKKCPQRFHRLVCTKRWGWHQLEIYLTCAKTSSGWWIKNLIEKAMDGLKCIKDRNLTYFDFWIKNKAQNWVLNSSNWLRMFSASKADEVVNPQAAKIRV